MITKYPNYPDSFGEMSYLDDDSRKSIARTAVI